MMKNDLEKVIAFLSAMSGEDSFILVATKRRDGVIDVMRGVHGNPGLLQGALEGLLQSDDTAKKMVRRAVKRVDNIK